MNNVTVTIFDKDFNVKGTNSINLTDSQIMDLRSVDVAFDLADMLGMNYNDDDTVTSDFFDLFD